LVFFVGFEGDGELRDVSCLAKADAELVVASSGSGGGREENLVCWAVDRLWRARLYHNDTWRGNTEPFRGLWRLSFTLRAVILDFFGDYTLRTKDRERDLTGVHAEEYCTPAAQTG